MTADQMKSRLTAAERKEIADRFIDVMRAQDIGIATPRQTIQALNSIYLDLETWLLDPHPQLVAQRRHAERGVVHAS